jgi:hypothetical protein
VGTGLSTQRYHVSQAMLIVNADDLGRSKAETNAAMACYAKGRITSTSAMVFMTDSERASEVASGAGLDHRSAREFFRRVLCWIRP